MNERFIERWVIADASSGPETAHVSRVIDGDTIEVTLRGGTPSVRLLLVDTPEVHGGEECYGPGGQRVRVLAAAGGHGGAVGARCH